MGIVDSPRVLGFAQVVPAGTARLFAERTVGPAVRTFSLHAGTELFGKLNPFTIGKLAFSDSHLAVPDHRSRTGILPVIWASCRLIKDRDQSLPRGILL
jgi:hypothetical protein